VGDGRGGTEEGRAPASGDLLMAIAAHTLMRTSRRSASALPCQPELEQTMKAIARVSLALLCCTSLGSAVLAQGDEGPFYQCTPRVYEEAGAKLDCLGADSRSESCEAFGWLVPAFRGQREGQSPVRRRGDDLTRDRRLHRNRNPGRCLGSQDGGQLRAEEGQGRRLMTATGGDGRRVRCLACRRRATLLWWIAQSGNHDHDACLGGQWRRPERIHAF
jgi:hypothetical protein